MSVINLIKRKEKLYLLWQHNYIASIVPERLKREGKESHTVRDRRRFATRKELGRSWEKPPIDLPSSKEMGAEIPAPTLLRNHAKVCLDSRPASVFRRANIRLLKAEGEA